MPLSSKTRRKEFDLPEIRSMRRYFMLLFGVIVTVAVAAPYAVRVGEDFFPVRPEYVESLIISIDGIAAFFVYKKYKNRLYSILMHQSRVERYLSDSYAHIGRVNNELELFKKFVATLPTSYKGEKDHKAMFTSLLSYMLVSVAHSESGYLRFIDVESGKTVKEYHYPRSQSHNNNTEKNSKGDVESNKKNTPKEKGVVVDSYYKNERMFCVLCFFPKSKKKVDDSLLRMLLTQTHLLFIAYLHGKDKGKEIAK